MYFETNGTFNTESGAENSNLASNSDFLTFKALFWIGRPILNRPTDSESAGRSGIILDRPADSESAAILDRSQHIHIWLSGDFPQKKKISAL